MPLPDILPKRASILFVGINPGLGSERLGHHYSGPGNPFFKLLHASGLIPVPLTPLEDRRVVEFGLGLTNLCPRASREASELSADELEAGARALAKKVERLKPRVVALVGVTIFRTLFPGSKSRGPGLKEERLGRAAVFVLPNPSGRNAAFPGFAAKLRWFRALATLGPTGYTSKAP